MTAVSTMQFRSRVEAIINEDGLMERMGYLRDRWEDEKEYEDFAEYRAAAEKAVNALADATFVSLGKNFHLRIKVYGNNVTLRVGLTRVSVVLG